MLVLLSRAEQAVRELDEEELSIKEEVKGKLKRIKSKCDEAEFKILRQAPLYWVKLAQLVMHYERKTEPRGMLRAREIIAGSLHCTTQEAANIISDSFACISRQYQFPYAIPSASRMLLIGGFRHEDEQDEKDDTAATQANRDTYTVTSSHNSVQDSYLDAGANTRSSIDSDSHSNTASPPESEEALEAVRKSKLAQQTSRSIEAGASHRDASAHVGLDVYSPDKPFYDITKHLKNNPGDYEDLHGMMGDAVKAVVEGMRLQRGCIILFNKTQTRMKSYYFHAADQNDPLKDYISVVAKNNIFGILKERPSSVWVKPNSPAKILKLIPEDFKQVSGSNSGFYMSVTIKNKVIGVFYCDNKDGAALSEEHYKHFKYLNKALAHALGFHATFNS